MDELYKRVNLEDEFKSSFLDYSMSVIVSRAIPDIRDGLKPVHRRILVAMNDLSLHHNAGFRKSAKITGEVTGKYHPHGTAAVYQAIARMAQPFSLRYPLVIGQGNFGSIDGDPPAAERYTEAKMSAVSDEMLRDLKKDTVPFVPNYDGTEKEPTILPSVVPNILVNGSSGIAVGMATEIPPHNLSEIIDGLLFFMDNPDCSTQDLMQYIKGPDFPTGGIINGIDPIKEFYETGRGKIRLRGRLITETDKSGREKIIITEIPYMVNKSRLIESIAHLINQKKINGISDLRDESDRDGIRVVLDMKRNENISVIMNQLFKYTQLEVTVGANFLALVDMSPRLLTLKQALGHFLAHRRNIIIRRTKFDLEKALQRAHILEGLKIAISNIDEVIRIIKSSQTVKDAEENLIATFELTQAQARAILDLKLQRLTGLEMEKIIKELEDLLLEIKRLQDILQSKVLVDNIIKDEFSELKSKYGDMRRTEIMMVSDDPDIQDMIKQEDIVVFLTNQMYIKRTSLSFYRSQRRAGTGKRGVFTKSDDFVQQIFTATTHDYFLITTNRGKLYWLKAYEIPESGNTSLGRAIINLINIGQDEIINTIVPITEFRDDQFLVFATKKGLIKKTSLSQYSRPTKSGIIAICLDEDDGLVASRVSSGGDDIMLVTRAGMSIRFSEDSVRATGRATRGVIGIKMKRKMDEVVSLALFKKAGESDASDLSCPYGLFTITNNGIGKITLEKKFRPQSRAGMGVINIRLPKKDSHVIGAKPICRDDDIIICTQSGKVIRFSSNSVSTTGRTSQGVKLQSLGEDDSVVSFATVPGDEDVD